MYKQLLLPPIVGLFEQSQNDCSLVAKATFAFVLTPKLSQLYKHPVPVSVHLNLDP